MVLRRREAGSGDEEHRAGRGGCGLDQRGDRVEGGASAQLDGAAGAGECGSESAGAVDAGIGAVGRPWVRRVKRDDDGRSESNVASQVVAADWAALVVTLASAATTRTGLATSSVACGPKTRVGRGTLASRCSASVSYRRSASGPPPSASITRRAPARDVIADATSMTSRCADAGSRRACVDELERAERDPGVMRQVACDVLGCAAAECCANRDHGAEPIVHRRPPVSVTTTQSMAPLWP